MYMRYLGGGVGHREEYLTVDHAREQGHRARRARLHWEATSGARIVGGRRVRHDINTDGDDDDDDDNDDDDDQDNDIPNHEDRHDDVDVSGTPARDITPPARVELATQASRTRARYPASRTSPNVSDRLYRASATTLTSVNT